jgi:very-short-patch-repair endonuclease
MRKAMTPPEARLSVGLKALRREGYHFRRQAPVRGYFLDFVCFSHRLIIEVDGASHEAEERAQKDRIRDAVFAEEGFMTLRFDNAAIRDNLGDGVEFVRRTLVTHPTRSPLRSDHPPHEGEGE